MELKENKVLSKELVVLCFCTFAMWMLMMAVYPISPVIIKDLGTDVTVFGKIVGISSFIMLLLNIPCGFISDRYGRKPCVIAGMAVLFISTLWICRASSALEFYLAWIAGGFGRGIFLSPAFSTVGDMYAPHKRGKAMGLLSSSLGLGSVAGYFISCFISEVYGWKKLFILFAFINLAGLILAFFLKETSKKEKTASIGKSTWSCLHNFWDKTIILCAVITILGFTAATGVNFIIPYLAESNHIALIYMSVILIPYEVVGIIGNVFVGAVSDKKGRKIPLAGILIIAMAATGLLLFEGTDMLKVIIFFAVLSFCEGPLIGITTTMVIDVIKRKDASSLGSALGMYRSLYSLGSVLGPFLAGSLIGAFAYKLSIFAMLILLLTAFLLSLFLKETAEIIGPEEKIKSAVKCKSVE